MKNKKLLFGNLNEKSIKGIEQDLILFFENSLYQKPVKLYINRYSDESLRPNKSYSKKYYHDNKIIKYTINLKYVTFVMQLLFYIKIIM
jgi:hypothetical protein